MRVEPYKTSSEIAKPTAEKKVSNLKNIQTVALGIFASPLIVLGAALLAAGAVLASPFLIYNAIQDAKNNREYLAVQNPKSAIHHIGNDNPFNATGINGENL